MAEFSATVYQNEFLPDGGTDVSAIVTVSCTGAGAAGQPGGGEAGEIIIVDTSGSMGRTRLEAAKVAAAAAVEQIDDGTWFAVIAGAHQAYLAFPSVRAGAGMVKMDSAARHGAHQAIRMFRSDGGTAMGTWLTLAGRLFDSVPFLAKRHAILLTDGENHNETPEQLTNAILGATGKFQCDCRGVGVDWEVSEVRRIAQALLGTVDIIPEPDQLEAEFAKLISDSMSRGVADAQLRVWAPQGAQVVFVRQVSPTVEDLTARRVAVNPLTGGYPTGSWGDESRDYHVNIRLSAKALGQEQLAARVQLAVGAPGLEQQVVAQGLVKARWSSDDALTTRINPEVAHYTGQTELAEAIQDGLAAKAAGDEETATQKLGRAVQLAAATGNDEATSRLRKVVDIDNPEAGTVRLKRAVDRADEMALDTASTKTTRCADDPPGGPSERYAPMTAVCPAGHTSASDDYCDVCGVPIEAGAAAPAPGSAPPDAPPAPTDAPTQAPSGTGQQPCPNCATPNADDALFCENCGYDFTTGTMPRPLAPPEPGPAPDADPDATAVTAAVPPEAPEAPKAPAQAPFTFVAEVWIDPAWYEAQESPDSLPSAGLPEVVGLRAPSNLIGRVSKSRNIHPEIDCGADSGVSRRQSQLTTDGTRWWVEDLESANGTFVGAASGALPEDPIPVGPKRELAADDRIYVGAWTRIVVRPATEDEQASLT